MTELELRTLFITTAQSWLGCKESDGSFKPIIDLYNAQSPLPVGYKMKYTDHWCACFVTAVGIKAGLTKIILPECGCSRMIDLYKKAGRWQENDAYVPTIGDIIMYDWQDNGAGDNMGHPDHVGIVTGVTSNSVTVIEGNKSESVSYRTLPLNGKYIRGYCLPNFASMATAPSATVSSGNSFKPEIGDHVTFIGSIHYSSANASVGKKCKPGTAKITGKLMTAKHPYHLIAETGSGSTVYGWVDLNDIKPNSSVIGVGSKVKIMPGAKYGGLALTRGKTVPSRYTGKAYTVKKVATHFGAKEALLTELNSWVAIAYLID